ncbi:Ltp family lipoprotein [Enteractinococcus helveticum]|uniref:Putative host cell surface-exposed lipoprotein Ltp-like HTH region domain-containing protein n=1 Tax=Enteractinococcus helveticum TaxID=1837282 RepID=A0A1B7M2R7_9MICC|nr:Ltp family lipoprotein [Enteractinococcus helveticum]OAV62855.1 hypothetical protein A6F49_04130 [Enteractinococcus helveticum]
MTAEAQSLQKTKKPIWKRWWMIVLYVIVGIGVISNLAGGGDSEAEAEPSFSPSVVEQTQDAESEETEEAEVETTPEEVEEEPAEVVEEEPVEDDVPSEHRSALRSAETYSDMMHMSKAGIFDQLTSEYGGQFTEEAAQYAVDNVEADWNNNALESAITYQDTMAMSPAAIHDQLTSEYGGQFTTEEADYAIANLP